MNTTHHTPEPKPRPVSLAVAEDGFTLVSPSGATVATMANYWGWSIDRATIVRCVNAHDDLLAALRRMVVEFEKRSAAETTCHEKNAYGFALDAIAKAEGR